MFGGSLLSIWLTEWTFEAILHRHPMSSKHQGDAIDTHFVVLLDDELFFFISVQRFLFVVYSQLDRQNGAIFLVSVHRVCSDKHAYTNKQTNINLSMIYCVFETRSNQPFVIRLIEHLWIASAHNTPLRSNGLNASRISISTRRSNFILSI